MIMSMVPICSALSRPAKSIASILSSTPSASAMSSAIQMSMPTVSMEPSSPATMNSYGG